MAPSVAGAWWQLVIVEFEGLLGVWLLAGVRPRGMYLAALLWFCGLAAVALFQALTGAATCGCFGALHVSPWVTLAIDAAAIVSLCFLRPPLEPSLLGRLRRGGVVYLAIVAGVAAPSAIRQAIAAVAGPQGPRLELPDGRSVLVEQEERLAGEDFVDGGFRIANSGAAPLEFSIRASCACSALSPISGVVPAHGYVHVSMRVGLDLKMEVRSTTVQILTNDPKHPVENVYISVHRRVLARAEPDIVSFGELTERSERKAEIRVTVLDAALCDQVARLRCEASGPCAVTHCEPTGSGLNITVATNRAQPGAHYGSVRVLSPAGRVLVEVPVTYVVFPSVTIVPPKLELPCQDERGVRRATFFVWVGEGHRAGELLSYEAPAGVVVREIDSGTLYRSRFELIDTRTAPGGGRAPNNRPFTIKLTFAAHREPVLVAVEAAPRLAVAPAGEALQSKP